MILSFLQREQACAARITGLPVGALLETPGILTVIDGGAAIPAGLSVRVHDDKTMTLHYRGATSLGPLEDFNFTDTTKIEFNVEYAWA